ncbi:MAG: UMP kinase [Candidatus Pacebacteria bacterium]|nr:UMP kinase [Candidatus Paceibacterota bacterium]
MQQKYKKILLKIGGEIFLKENSRGVSVSAYRELAEKIVKIKTENNIELSIVIGGGNIFRGREIGEENFDRVVGDNMGMVATTINGLGLEEALNNAGCPAKMMAAIKIGNIEMFNKAKAAEYLAEGKVLIFAGGTGNPFFTTDSAAALRACELDCDLIMKATNVDGVYDKDPDENADAKLYKQLSYEEAIDKKLKVMDGTAFVLCRENKKPIIVFNVKDILNIGKALRGESFGTLVS